MLTEAFGRQNKYSRSSAKWGALNESVVCYIAKEIIIIIEVQFCLLRLDRPLYLLFLRHRVYFIVFGAIFLTETESPFLFYFYCFLFVLFI